MCDEVFLRYFAKKNGIVASFAPNNYLYESNVQ